MLNWAKEYMKETGSEFIITGEVLNQRPMSQTRERLKLVEKETGLEGLILRPLSAKELEPTTPEIKGWVNREELLSINGRSRKMQMELARNLGLLPEEYGQPAGGCLLTDPGYSSRLEDLWTHQPRAGANDISLLRVGRHFWVGKECKVIVGRNELDNQMIELLMQDFDCILALEGIPGPTTLVRGKFGDAELKVAAALTFKYGHAEGEAIVKVDGRENLSVRVNSTELADLLKNAAPVLAPSNQAS
jgi:tRNA U34 2-thiouridine synthase MnmA/TrmU